MGIQVLTPLGDRNETLNWYASEWGGARKFPSAVTLYESRLWWGGKAKLWGSVSDAYSSFNDEGEDAGASSAIRRTIGFGPVDRIEWLAPSSRLIAGIASNEISVRSSSFGEVITNVNCNLKSGSSQGAAPIEPIIVDDAVMFVQRSGIKIFDANYAVDKDTHRALDLMTLNPSICKEGIRRMAAARQPETRLYVVLADGSMRIHLVDPAEDVLAWSRVVTVDGNFSDVAVLPGNDEDWVYVSIFRDGIWWLEKFEKMVDATPHHYDSAVNYFDNSSTVLGNLLHLEGKTVHVWGDGQFRETRVVSGGSITVSDVWSTVTAGMRYVAQWKSNKVSKYIKESVIGRRKRVVDVQLSMLEYWPGGIKLGPSFDELEIMPEVEYGPVRDQGVMIDDYDETPFSFNGDNEVDPRICIQADGPCTILSLSYAVMTDGDTQ